jgi:hypothetical protein
VSESERVRERERQREREKERERERERRREQTLRSVRHCAAAEVFRLLALLVQKYKY